MESNEYFDGKNEIFVSFEIVNRYRIYFHVQLLLSRDFSTETTVTRSTKNHFRFPSPFSLGANEPGYSHKWIQTCRI